MAAAQIQLFRLQLRQVTADSIRVILDAADARPLLALGFSQARIRNLWVPASEGRTCLPTPGEFLALSYLSGLAPESAIQVLLGQEAFVGHPSPIEETILEKAQNIQSPEDWQSKCWDPQCLRDLQTSGKGGVYRTVLASLLGIEPAHLRQIADGETIPAPPVAARIYYLAGINALEAWGVTNVIQDEAWVGRARAAWEAVCAWTPSQYRSANVASLPGSARELDEEQDEYTIQRLATQIPLAAAIKRFGAGTNLLLEDGTGGLWRWHLHWSHEGRPMRANLAKLDPVTFVESDEVRSSEVEGKDVIEVLVRMARLHAGIEAWPVVALRWMATAACVPQPAPVAEPVPAAEAEILPLVPMVTGEDLEDLALVG